MRFRLSGVTPAQPGPSYRGYLLAGDGGGVVHAYFGETATVVAEAAFGDRNAAVVSTGGDKGAAVRAVQELKRRGSP